MTILAVRSWVAQYGRWLTVAGWFLGFFAQGDKRYDYAALGTAIASIGTWGLLLHADLPGKPFGYRRPFLTILLRLSVGLTLLSICLFFAVQTP
ncbi:hypothetical protein [Nitrospirillum bahiense]|uniref:hypothetical protein n=1 Tax=Nitrospirillum amazonense TaxID=28077 RepID=UPI0011A5CDAD|nr:hypothetical protein [Nitrospirillum amazonense]